MSLLIISKNYLFRPKTIYHDNNKGFHQSSVIYLIKFLDRLVAE